MPPGEGCCGSLVHHMGREDEARAQARANIDAWTREIEGEGLDAIVITTSGCGTTVKDYGYMFATTRPTPAKAAKVSALARDVTEVLAELGAQAAGAAPGSGSPTTPPARCSTASASSGTEGAAPARRLRGGGSAGGASLLRLGRHLQPPAAGDRRTGCATQGREHRGDGARRDRRRQHRLHHADRGGHRVPVVHTVELLDWATGGPVPAGLQKTLGRLK